MTSPGISARSNHGLRFLACQALRDDVACCRCGRESHVLCYTIPPLPPRINLRDLFCYRTSAFSTGTPKPISVRVFRRTFFVPESRATKNNSFLAVAQDWDLSQVYHRASLVVQLVTSATELQQTDRGFESHPINIPVTLITHICVKVTGHYW